jgi:hypothetical protein
MSNIRQPLYGEAAARVRDQLAATPAPAIRMREATAPTGHPHPLLTETAREHPAADDRITALAAAVYVAGAAYTEARTMPNPAATLDDMCDAWPEIAPQVMQVTKTGPELFPVLKDAVADQLWAYTAIEYARAEAGDGYGYVFDLLVEWLRKGGDPHLVRTTALDVPARIRASAEQAGGDE